MAKINKFENSFVSNIQPYRLASHTIWESPEKAGSILKLDWNEATVPPSQHVVEAIISAVTTPGLNYYPDVVNYDLLNLLAAYSEVEVQEVQYFPSSDVAHENIVSTFVNPADYVLILGPTYDNFRLTAESAGAAVEFFNYSSPNFSVDINGLSSLIAIKAPKLVYICNPNNPTGSVISEDSLRLLLSAHTDSLFVIDEAYYEFYGQSVASLVGQFDNLIVTRTFSKAFALAGVRIGYACASENLITCINKIRNAKNTSTLSQVAAIAALQDINYVANYVDEVVKTRNSFSDWMSMNSQGMYRVVVGEGNFILLIFQAIEEKLNVINCLKENNIFVRDLRHSGLELAIRITVGTEYQMEVVKEVLEGVFAR